MVRSGPDNGPTWTNSSAITRKAITILAAPPATARRANCSTTRSAGNIINFSTIVLVCMAPSNSYSTDPTVNTMVTDDRMRSPAGVPAARGEANRGGEPSLAVDVPVGEDRGRGSPEDATVRETLEKTGLGVRTTVVIDGRVHPLTEVRIVYVAAEVMGEPGAVGTCSDELAEVRLVGLAEAGELMPRHVRRGASARAAGTQWPRAPPARSA